MQLKEIIKHSEHFKAQWEQYQSFLKDCDPIETNELKKQFLAIVQSELQKSIQEQYSSYMATSDREHILTYLFNYQLSGKLEPFLYPTLPVEPLPKLKIGKMPSQD